ncbi:murein L,D-transpeptidase family protein [Methylobacterium sp. J-090]|uniref:L,D-transpeptidase family protein n=1 Tax=Methylobacterium sp. J-090 TaxID=2836666 RepID=UPI001FB900B5|nr:L,D-transpeptidase family protein [Methylobacterium sp. J-090]MCJ2082528.1 L,D-transpeptidase family protein [Methylobacterium sp. J-090]
MAGPGPHRGPRGRRWIGSIAALVVLGVLGLALVDQRQWTRVEPDLVVAPERADRILVEKAARRLTLLREGRVLATYPVSLGFSPIGQKAREGDGRTPEGIYAIAYRNPRSVAHLSLKVSYPTPEQAAEAAAEGREPGGDIMIHGVFNGFSWVGPLHQLVDWTNGCVGVTNAEMEAIYARVDVGTPVEIRP